MKNLCEKLGSVFLFCLCSIAYAAQSFKTDISEYKFVQEKLKYVIISPCLPHPKHPVYKHYTWILQDDGRYKGILHPEALLNNPTLQAEH